MNYYFFPSGDSNWANGNNWWDSPGGGGTQYFAVPTAFDDAYIDSDGVYDTGGAAECLNLIVGSVSPVTSFSGLTITVAATFTIYAGSTSSVTVNCVDLNINGSGINSGSVTVSNTIICYGTNSGSVISSSTADLYGTNSSSFAGQPVNLRNGSTNNGTAYNYNGAGTYESGAASSGGVTIYGGTFTLASGTTFTGNITITSGSSLITSTTNTVGSITVSSPSTYDLNCILTSSGSGIANIVTGGDNQGTHTGSLTITGTGKNTGSIIGTLTTAGVVNGNGTIGTSTVFDLGTFSALNLTGVTAGGGSGGGIVKTIGDGGGLVG